MPLSPSHTARHGPASASVCCAVLARRNEIGLLVALLVIIVLFAVLSDTFFTVRNMTNVLGQASLAMTAGIGVAIVFISGEVDVSVGSLVAAIAIPLITIMNATGSLALGIAGALAARLAGRHRQRLSRRLSRNQFADRHAGHAVHHARRSLSLYRSEGHSR